MATGKIQSTNRPDVQNSICGVGSLLTNFEFGTVTGPIVCITLFKKKSATLSIARLTPEDVEGTGMQDVVGSVTLKYNYYSLFITHGFRYRNWSSECIIVSTTSSKLCVYK